MARKQKKHQFQFTIEGEGVSPETVSLRELADLFVNLETVVAATAKSNLQGKCDPADLQLNLVGVMDKCDELTFAANDVMYRATNTVVRAIEENSFDDVPVSAHSNLRNLWRRAKATKRSYRISSRENGLPSATISSAKELLLPTMLAGATTLLAKVDRTGGEVEPTAKLILMDGEELTVELDSRDLAIELGKRLFQVVSLDGDATWDFESWKLKRFVVRRIGEYQDSSASEAFRELSEAAGNRWESIDPREFVAELRAE